MNEKPTPLSIPADILDAMVAHCRRDAPLECCGLLGGNPPVVSSFHPLRNTEASPTRYLADAQQVVEAVVALRARKAEIVAIYHSHPDAAAIPSQVDLDLNYYGSVPRIIVSLQGPEPAVRIWRLEPDSYEELPWQIVPTPAAGSASDALAVEREASSG
jgi:proteasome lid subunit RPN8/RPN11